MNCLICFEIYNTSNRKPYVLNCGHTFCFDCLEKQINSCPTCRLIITNKIPNYALFPQDTVTHEMNSNQADVKFCFYCLGSTVGSTSILLYDNK